VRITDRGPGITADQRDNVFQPFRRTDAPGDGRTGDVTLGLAVAKGFTEAMHGELTVEETPGGGATFVLSLRALRPGRD
jgi:two-component system sensor histidine kinase KdpD